MNMTLDSHSNYQQQEQESITKPESRLRLSPKPATLGPKSTDRNRLGDYWEYHVALVAMDKGAEVFKNVCCTGKTDMILKINGQLYQIGKR